MKTLRAELSNVEFTAVPGFDRVVQCGSVSAALEPIPETIAKSLVEEDGLWQNVRRPVRCVAHGAKQRRDSGRAIPVLWHTECTRATTLTSSILGHTVKQKMGKRRTKRVSLDDDNFIVIAHWLAVSLRDSAIQLLGARGSCSLFREAIDAQVQILLKDDEAQSVRGLTKFAKRTVQRLAHRSFATLAFLQMHRCVLCKQKFSGTIHPVGIYAHTHCVRSHSFSIYYLERPLTDKARARMADTNRDLLVAADHAPFMTEEYVLNTIPTFEVDGYQVGWHGYGSYSYRQALVGPEVATLPRSMTLLGRAFESEQTMERARDVYAIKTVISDMIARLEEEQAMAVFAQKARAFEELQQRRKLASERRMQRMGAALLAGRYILPSGAASYAEWHELMLSRNVNPYLTNAIRCYVTEDTLVGPGLARLMAVIHQLDAESLDR